VDIFGGGVLGLWVEKYQKSLPEFFLNRAFEVAEASACMRSARKIGAVAVKNGEEIASGYNGIVGKIPPCHERGYCIRDKKNVPSGTMREIAYCICAEQRLICNAARDGVSLEGAEIYVTHMPCAVCLRLMIESGITRVYYKHDYPNQFAKEICTLAGFEMLKIG